MMKFGGCPACGSQSCVAATCRKAEPESTEEDYDVVFSTLMEKRDRLWKMTKQNMNSEYVGMGIMDDIRLRQIDQLDKALDMWKKQK